MTGFLSRRDRPGASPSIFMKLSRRSACLCCFFSNLSFLCNTKTEKVTHLLREGNATNKDRKANRDYFFFSVRFLLFLYFLKDILEECKRHDVKHAKVKEAVPYGPFQSPVACHSLTSSPVKPLSYFYLKKAFPVSMTCTVS